MLIDMHTHSSCSDGILTPSELVAQAYENGISVLALTDHDTVSGCREAGEACSRYGIRFIPGAEITGRENDKLHILGYGIDPEDPGLNNAFIKLADGRTDCAAKICGILKEMGVDISFEEVMECVPGPSVGKPHIAEVMIRKGYVSSVAEAFEKYFRRPEIKAVKKYKLPAAEVIGLIHRSGGIAVLAHPYQLKLDDEQLYEFVRDLKDLGLDGIECYYSRYTPEMTAYYLKMADEFGLLASIGSDFHGELRKPGVKLGTGIDNSLISLQSIKEFDGRILEKIIN